MARILCMVSLIAGLAGSCSGGPDEPVIIHSALGARLSLDGVMLENDLQYSLKPYRGGGLVKDLFNYIYFQGDTVCFAVHFSKNIEPTSIRIRFTSPETGASFDAERVDVYRNRVFGFSLVGSCLEKFYRQSLDVPVSSDMWCCRDIPFEVEVRVHFDKSAAETRIKGSFRIQYIR